MKGSDITGIKNDINTIKGIPREVARGRHSHKHTIKGARGRLQGVFQLFLES